MKYHLIITNDNGNKNIGSKLKIIKIDQSIAICKFTDIPISNQNLAKADGIRTNNVSPQNCFHATDIYCNVAIFSDQFTRQKLWILTYTATWRVFISISDVFLV